jgi:4-nitrophenyl phosphatase
MRFSTITGVVMDMDGVLWRGETPLPGLDDLFQWLNERDIPYALATNNSSRTPENYVDKLARMGIADVPARCIVTSATATAAYLRAHYPDGIRVHVFGMDGLRQMLQSAGLQLTAPGGEPAEVVVAGIDFDLTYEALKQAALAIRAGADFIGTNPDKTFPTPDGLIPGTGSMLAALETATDRTPTIIGKPETPMFEAALAITGTRAENTLMIGDRLGTDILGGKQAGMKTALLFTGVTTPDDLIRDADTVWPDVAYEGLPDLVRAWAGDDWYQATMKAKRQKARN